MASSRQLKRIESVKRSPIYNHFFESINGVTVIRAHKLQLEFTEENENRIDDNQAAYLPNMMANRFVPFLFGLFFLTFPGIYFILK